MAYIRSASPDFDRLTEPSTAVGYRHGADTRQGYLPVAFQITSPYAIGKALLPHALVLHVNPASFQENFNKKIERIQTRGGFVEQHWGDDLGEVSCDGSTGAFINLHTGLASVVRQRTIAWDRYRDLVDLYRNNGSVHDPYGNIVLQGQVMLMYDRGTYFGSFRKISIEETDDAPFAFKLSWSFKVETTVYSIPLNGFNPGGPAPVFQRSNTSTLEGTVSLGRSSEEVTTKKFGEAAATRDAALGIFPLSLEGTYAS